MTSDRTPRPGAALARACRRGLREVTILCLLLTVCALAAWGGAPTSTGVRPDISVAPASSQTPSAWDAPALSSPQTIELTDSTRNLKLNQSQDYVLACDNTGTLTYGLVVWGGHNVVLKNCDYNQGGSSSGAAQFKNQTGTLWLADDHFAGTALSEGIDLQEPGTTTVVMRDVLIDTVHGSASTNHADCLQTWSGPHRLLIDGFTCETTYQGLFLMPNQRDSTTQESVWDLRHIELALDAGHGAAVYLGWFGTGGGSIDFNAQDVYESGVSAPDDFPDHSTNCQGPCGVQMPDVNTGAPPVPGGHYVLADGSHGAVGVDEPGDTGTADGAGVDPVPLAGEQ